MGSGGSKKKNVVKQDAPKLSPKVPTPQIRSSPSPPPLPPIPSQRPSVRNQSPSLLSRVSAKRNSINPANDIEGRSLSRKLNNKTPDNEPLPPISNGNYKSPSRGTRRTSSIAPVPLINQSRLSLQSLAHESAKQSFRKKSPSIHGHSGRCSKCPHCRQLATNTASTNVLTSPEPEWITKNPGPDQVCINMDKYDVEAVKDKIISKNHHLLGSYDYEPYLVIEQIEGGYDPKKENYYTQPFILKVDPTVQPIRTPFPEYSFLRRHDRRLNKPYSLPLFD